MLPTIDCISLSLLVSLFLLSLCFHSFIAWLIIFPGLFFSFNGWHNTRNTKNKTKGRQTKIKENKTITRYKIHKRNTKCWLYLLVCDCILFLSFLVCFFPLLCFCLCFVSISILFLLCDCLFYVSCLCRPIQRKQ